MSKPQPKKLQRSTSDRMWLGVCGGVATYFATDPALVRLAVVFVTLATGFFPGLFVYIVAGIILPEDNQA